MVFLHANGKSPESSNMPAVTYTKMSIKQFAFEATTFILKRNLILPLAPEHLHEI